jgi:hypothetical protein
MGAMLAEQGAAPAGAIRNRAPGTPRVTVRPYYGGLPFSGLDAGRMKGGESLPDQGGRDAPRPAPEATVPGRKIAAVKRRKARRSASWTGGPGRFRDRPDRKAGHGVRRSAPAPDGASPPRT